MKIYSYEKEKTLIMQDNKGKSFVTIMLIIALCALSLRIIIAKLIEINIAQNESYASLTLKFISAGLENYAKNNQGIYPANLPILTKSQPPYLDKDYINLSPVKGYNFSCSRLESSGYSCTAIPVKCSFTGKTIYTISTGALLISEECNRKD